MRLIKKSEQAILSKIKKIEELELQNIQADTEDISETVFENDQAIYVEGKTPNYVPARDNPIVRSVGNSGWQISDVWRDIRVDNFCD
jgi:hypothetical protein